MDDVNSKAMETVFDVRQHLGADKHIKQIHSSNDDRCTPPPSRMPTGA